MLFQIMYGTKRLQLKCVLRVPKNAFKRITTKTNAFKRSVHACACNAFKL